MLGDPYIVEIPRNILVAGENISVKIGTGISEENAKGGSPWDKVIYTFSVKNIGIAAYSGVFEKASGCNVTIYYDMNGDNLCDGSTLISIGPKPDGFDPDKDAIDYAFLKLLDKLNFINDLNENQVGNGTIGNPYDGINESNPIDLPLDSNINFNTNYISNIQSLWGPARLEIIIWI